MTATALHEITARHLRVGDQLSEEGARGLDNWYDTNTPGQDVAVATVDHKDGMVTFTLADDDMSITVPGHIRVTVTRTRTTSEVPTGEGASTSPFRESMRNLEQRQQPVIPVDPMGAVNAEIDAAMDALTAAGITDAYLMEPGSGCVHVPFGDGAVFLSDRAGGQPGSGTPGYFVGVYFDDGSEEVVLHDAKSRAEAHTTLVGAVQRLREVAP